MLDFLRSLIGGDLIMVFGDCMNSMAPLIRNPIVLIILVLWLMKQYYVYTSKEIDFEGSKVVHIKNADHYNEVVLKAKASGSIVIVNFYINYWSNACQVAAPMFAELSKLYGKDNKKCQFWRINVDTVPDAARANGIISYPTFKIFKDNIEVDEVQGWKEKELIDKINKHVVVQQQLAVTSSVIKDTGEDIKNGNNSDKNDSGNVQTKKMK